ncbi:MAG TPA: hypothetical protein DCS42_04705, partial [Nitrospiraceae bacterium]|nr:hypothetical protein [Nitrospiraceae bacterium]
MYSSNGTATQAETTTVYGTAKDYSGIASVTVNGVPASYRSSDGYYELAVALVLGDNTFAVAATDGAGNVQRLTLTVKRLPQPDLTMVALADPESGVTGGEVTISNTVTAAPTGGNAGSFYVGIYLSTDATITTADTLLGLRYLTSLSAGEAIAHDTSALIPTSLKPGIYYLGAIADYKNSVIESDETNNVLLGGQFTVIGPDLTVSAVSGPASSGTNANIAISTTVAALASGGNAGSFNMNIYLSTDSTITTSDRKIGFRSFTGMAAGATSTADTVANIPVGIPPGTYYIGAIVDIYNWVTESDETNNSFVGNQITLVGPDLAMSAVSEPAQGGTNGTLTVTNTV